MIDLSTQVSDAIGAVQGRWPRKPQVGIILGTGLGGFAKQVDAEAVIGYETIPHFPRSTAIGHRGQFVCGTIGGLGVVTMEGRFHLYEGYSAQQITLPVRVMKALGIELLIISNASGAVNPEYKPGDVMVIDDHINLMGANPLTGPNVETLGPRFPDLSRPYDPVLIERALQIAKAEQFVAHRGVYVALSGPNYETRAEYRFLRMIGGDVVGMSTVPEVIVAAHMKLPVLALSTITNVALPDSTQQPTDGHDVINVAALAETKVRKIVLGILDDVRQGLASK
ncbi:MAG TPA: purine-nucleoside phosphorylase [Planctomycetaceae bacterium]|nr:purine-nucleoside phosphorylase [Planctomycetaceae bacterium]